MHPIVFYSIIKENKIVSFAGTWIMFNEMSQTQKMQMEVIMRYTSHLLGQLEPKIR